MYKDRRVLLPEVHDAAVQYGARLRRGEGEEASENGPTPIETAPRCLEVCGLPVSRLPRPEPTEQAPSGVDIEGEVALAGEEDSVDLVCAPPAVNLPPMPPPEEPPPPWLDATLASTGATESPSSSAALGSTAGTMSSSGTALASIGPTASFASPAAMGPTAASGSASGAEPAAPSSCTALSSGVRPTVEPSSSPSGASSSGGVAATVRPLRPLSQMTLAQLKRENYLDMKKRLRASKCKCTCGCPIHRHNCGLRSAMSVVRNPGADVGLTQEDLDWMRVYEKSLGR